MEEMKGKILCIDDDEDTCEMLSTLLGDRGYEVIVATSVTEGLRLAKNEGSDLILTDLLFRDGTGFELCQMIRTFDSQTPILFCSGARDQSFVEEAKEAGAQGYLIKPCESEKLERAIAALIGEKKLQGLKVDSQHYSMARTN